MAEEPAAAPTEAPEAAPTGEPTAAPAGAPSTVPTEAPTTATTEAIPAAPTEAQVAASAEVSAEPPVAHVAAAAEEHTTAPSDATVTAPLEAPAAATAEVPTAPPSAPTAAPTEEPAETPTEALPAAPMELPTVATTDKDDAQQRDLCPTEPRADDAKQYQVSRDVDGTLRRVDPETGDVELYTSIDGILKAVPSLNWDLAAAWSRLPILRVHLFIDRGSYERGGVARPYASKDFYPDGVDLISAISFWRRRVREAGKGFAVFEGGFDCSGVCMTDPPYFKLDGSDGSVDADDMDAIQRKRELHEKRRKLEQRWASKGASDAVLLKIKQADAHRLHRKAQGEEYQYRRGWVSALAAQTSPRSPPPARLVLPALR